MRLLLVPVLLLTVSCSGSDEPSDPITRIDGPAVVDEDEGGATNDSSDG